MENEFLANLPQEGKIETTENPEEGQKEEKETPPASPAEKPEKDEPAPPAEGEKEGESPKEGEPAVFQAFHKHPRWKALQDELKNLRDFRDKATPLLERLGQEPQERQEESVEIPAWFSGLFGDNKEAWVKYRSYDAEQRKTLRSEILQEVRQEEERQISEQKKQEKWVDDEIQKLADEGLKFDRNELLKIALEWLPTDEEGNISFSKAYKILENLKAGKPEKPSSDEKKKIADQTMKKSKETDGKKDYKTSADLRYKSFHDLIPEE